METAATDGANASAHAQACGVMVLAVDSASVTSTVDSSHTCPRHAHREGGQPRAFGSDTGDPCGSGAHGQRKVPITQERVARADKRADKEGQGEGCERCAVSTRTGARCTSCASSGPTAGLARCCGLIAYRCRCTCLGWSARADRQRASPCSCHRARKPFCAQGHPPHDASTTGGSDDLDGRPAGATGVALLSLTNQAPELLLPASRDLANGYHVARDWNADLKRNQETMEHDLQQCHWAEGKRQKLEAYTIEMEGSLAEAQADLAATQLLTLISVTVTAPRICRASLMR